MNESLQDQARKLKSELPHTRSDGRKPEEPRPFSLEVGYTMHAEGSVLVSSGHTKVICTASVEERLPAWRRGSGQGWITAEYGMLPRATSSRATREVTAGRPSGRSLEIQRLIGRSLRSAVDLSVLGEHTVWIDCDVIQADGGTRTAAIAGGFVALVMALRRMHAARAFARPPVTRYVSSVSVGWLDDVALLDLNYEEDSRAEVDLNVVMTDRLDVIEVQGTAEGRPFSRAALDAMLDRAEVGVRQRLAAQMQALGDRLV
ncbi:MAG TPA: ribonuclease PH [bacterium]|nr:ribonuclease PH [bacterium]